MANNLNTNPVSVDTFAADVTISDSQVYVKCVTFSSPGADHCVMTDLAGNIVYDSRVSAGESDNQTIDTNIKGLVVDVSAGSFTAAAQLLVYLN